MSDQPKQEPTKTLRDEFAMAALTTYLGIDCVFQEATDDEVAKLSYRMADAMMKARNE